MFGEYVAGLSFTGDTLRTAVIKLKNSGPMLCYLAEEKIHDRTGAWFLRAVLEPRRRLLKKIRSISVGVDNGSVFYHSFPLDQSSTGGDRSEQMDWELANFIGGYSPSEFIKEIRVLSSDPQRNTQDVLVVAANKAFVRNVQSTILENKLRLQVIETNFFGASYALSANYPETDLKKILHATIETDRVDAGIFNKGKLERHLCGTVESPEDVIALLGRTIGDRDIDATFLSGEGASHSLVLLAGQQLGRKIELLNPTRRLILKRRYVRNNEYAGVEHRFASVIGCALRKQ